MTSQLSIMTDLEQFGLIEQLNQAGYTLQDSDFTPVTINDDISPEELTPSLTESPMSDINDASFFMDLRDNKISVAQQQYYTYQPESQGQQAISPSESTHSELIDLENGYLYPASVDEFAPDDDYRDPDWMPTTISEPQQTYNSTAKYTNSRAKQVSDAKSIKNTVAATSPVGTPLLDSVSNNTTSKASNKQPTNKRKRSSTSEIELQIEIEESTKRAKRIQVPLTEEQKRLRRKELNRLAAQRCRSKRRGRGEELEDEIEILIKKNRELREQLEELESTKTELYDIIKFHFASCHGKSQ